MRENEIASNFAFIFVTSDNSLKVMAVYVKEHVNKRRITIRIASNTEVSTEVTSGFRTLAGSLEQTAPQNSKVLRTRFQSQLTCVQRIQKI